MFLHQERDKDMKASALFRLFPQEVPTTGEEKESLRVRQIVRSLSKGNISLQLGHYATETEIMERKKRVLCHSFL